MIKRSGIRVMVGLVAVLAVWGSYQAIAGWVKPASVKEVTNRHREDNPANAAAIEAGFRKKPTPFETILKLLPKLSDNEWQQVVRSRKKGT